MSTCQITLIINSICKRSQMTNKIHKWGISLYLLNNSPIESFNFWSEMHFQETQKSPYMAFYSFCDTAGGERIYWRIKRSDTQRSTRRDGTHCWWLANAIWYTRHIKKPFSICVDLTVSGVQSNVYKLQWNKFVDTISQSQKVRLWNDNKNALNLHNVGRVQARGVLLTGIIHDNG